MLRLYWLVGAFLAYGAPLAQADRCINGLVLRRDSIQWSNLLQGVLNPVFHLADESCSVDPSLKLEISLVTQNTTIHCGNGHFQAAKSTSSVEFEYASASSIPPGEYLFDFSWGEDRAHSMQRLIQVGQARHFATRAVSDSSDLQQCANSFRMPHLGVGLLSALFGRLKLGTTFSTTECAKNWVVEMELIDKLTDRTYGCGEIDLIGSGSATAICVGLPFLGLVPNRRYELVGYLRNGLSIRYLKITSSALAGVLRVVGTLPIVSLITTLPASPSVVIAPGAQACVDSLEWSEIDTKFADTGKIFLMAFLNQGRSRLQTTISFKSSCGGYNIDTTLYLPSGATQTCSTLQVRGSSTTTSRTITCDSARDYAFAPGYYFISTASPGNSRKRHPAISRRDTATAMSPEFEITAQSSLPSTAVRKRKISTPDRPLHSERLCGSGYSACLRLGNLKTHECIDVDSDLHSCGGCPGSRAAIDYGDIDGASDVACVSGRCIVSTCDVGLEVDSSGSACVASHSVYWQRRKAMIPLF